MTRLVLPPLLLVLLAAGCADVDPECVDCRPPTVELERITTRSFLIRSVTFPRAVTMSTGERVAVGLDLDGIDSGEGSTASGASCNELQEDYASALGAFGGVDNAGQELIETAESTVDDGTTFNDALAEAVAEGRIRWAIRVGGLAGEPERVELELMVIDDTIRRDLDGVPVADQTLRAHRVARTNADVRGSVAWGYVTDVAELSVTDDDVFLLPFDDFYLGGLAIEAGPDSGLVRGHLAGSFSVEALTALAVELTGPEFGPGVESVFRSIYQSVADLRPAPGDPTSCERISVGFELEAVPVNLTE